MYSGGDLTTPKTGLMSSFLLLLFFLFFTIIFLVLFLVLCAQNKVLNAQQISFILFWSWFYLLDFVLWACTEPLISKDQFSTTMVFAIFEPEQSTFKSQKLVSDRLTGWIHGQ